VAAQAMENKKLI